MITDIINNLEEKNYDLLKKELANITTNINIKEDDELFLTYYDNKHKNDITQLERNTKSVIFEKETLLPLVTQHNKIYYNNDALEYLKDKKWENVKVEKCYEGTVLTVYHHKKWYISTRRCLDASESKWIKNKSYKDMFLEAIEGKFELEDLDKNLCYYFILIHFKNKNIINYANNGFGDNYKEVIHFSTTEKYTLKETEYDISNIKKVEKINFNNLDELLLNINSINDNNINKKCITMEGYILKVYDENGNFTILKIQTSIYQILMKIKPNNSNVNQSYLELYQNDKLNDYLPYFTKYNTDIIKRIHMSMRTIAKEVLDLYHGTRQKKNPEVYKLLKDQYKKVLYGLHGLFISFRKPTDKNNKQVRSITVHDVYHYLKNLTPVQLRQIFHERMYMLDNNINCEYLNNECINTLTLSTLMFQNRK